MLLLYLNFDLAGGVENRPRITEPVAGIKNIYRSFLSFEMLASLNTQVAQEGDSRSTPFNARSRQLVVNYDRAGNKTVSGIFETFKLIGANAKVIR